MSEDKILNLIKESISKDYNSYKESYLELKNEISTINSELILYNKFLKMVKKPNDIYKKSTLQFYENNIVNLLINSVSQIAEAYDNTEEATYQLQLLSITDEGNEFTVIHTVKIRIEQLNTKLESIGNTNIYSEQISKIKRILKSLNSNMFFEDETAYNTLINYIVENKTISNNDMILNFLKEKRNQYLETQQRLLEEKEKQRLLKQQEIKSSEKIEIQQNQNTTNTYKFNDEDFFSIEELKTLKEVNNLIYTNISILNTVNEDIINLIKESLKSNNSNINLDTIFPNLNITNYDNIIILFEIKKIVEEIDKIIEDIKSNNILVNTIEVYKNKINTLVSKITALYNCYIFEEEIIEEHTEQKNDKHIIYIQNASGELLIKNDIKNNPDCYKYFIEMLEELKAGIISSNHQKDVRFTNNGKLSDVCKKKNHSARLAYCPYNDCYIVFTGFIKKNNNNNYENNLVKNRYGFYKPSIDNIIKELSDEEKRSKIIEENDIIHKEFMNYLKTNSRDKKKILKKDLS